MFNKRIKGTERFPKKVQNLKNKMNDIPGNSIHHYKLKYIYKILDTRIHGTDPQLLIEKILRERIYESLYWKDKCFALSAETFVDRAVECKAIGGYYANQKPTDFICLTLKLLMLNPEKNIILLFLEDMEFKYLRALAAFYIRLTFSSMEIYQYLEPLLLDKRKLRFRKVDGNHIITFMDQFIDDLLREDRVFGTILPRMTKRHVFEEMGDIESRISPLENEFMDVESDSDSSEEESDVDEQEDKIVTSIDLKMDSIEQEKKKWSKTKVNSLFKKSSKPPTKDLKESTKEKELKTSGESMSIQETNQLRASLGLKPLE